MTLDVVEADARTMVEPASHDAMESLFVDRPKDLVVRIDRHELDLDWGPLADEGPTPGPRGGKPWTPKKAARRRMQKRSRKANR